MACVGDFFMGINSLTENGKKYARVVIISLLVYLSMKFLSPIASPFILAFLMAGMINPLVTGIHRKIRIKKSVVAGVIVLITCVILIVACWLLLSVILSGGKNLAGQIPEFQEKFCLLLKTCCGGMEKKIGIDGIIIENFILEQVDVFVENLEVNVFPSMLGKSFECVKSVGVGISFLVIMVIAVLLIVKDYDELIATLRKEEGFKAVFVICEKVVVYVKTFVKAQFIILCTISILCAVTLFLIGMKGGIFYGLLTGFMDMLPFVGTGIMLMPLAIFNLLEGQYWQGAVCVVLYVVCALTREFLEPKLIGKKVGVWPVGILFAVFGGIKLFGISGIIKGPLSLVIICEICKYLSKKEEVSE